jgi:TonB family protein
MKALYDVCRCALVCLAAGLLIAGESAWAAKKKPRAWSGPTANVVEVSDVALADVVLGSGVMFPGGKVLTDCRAFAEGDDLEVRQGATRSSARLAYADRKRDLCELKVTHPERFRPAPLRTRGTTDLDPGETVYAVGGSQADRAVVKGRVAKVTVVDDDEVVLISPRLGAVFSGGALFDRSGALIGILSYREGSGEKFALVYPARAILLRQAGDGQGAPVPAADAADTNTAKTDSANTPPEPNTFRSVAEDYLNRLAEASRTRLKVLEEARSQGWKGTTSIRFELDPGGELRESFVDTSSGYAGLDVSVLLAVRKAIEELPIPEAVKEKGLKGTVAITFVPAGERRE